MPSKLLTLSTISNKIRGLGKKIKVPKGLYPTFGSSIDFGHPHIEVDRNGYHYVVVERGIEHEKRTTQDIDELMYWVFKAITFSMASDYELHNRIPNQDFRRLLFAKQIELIKIINPAFFERLEKEKNEILKQHPYED